MRQAIERLVGGLEKSYTGHEDVYRKTAIQVRDAIKDRIGERTSFITEQEPILRERLQETGMGYTFDQVIQMMLGNYFQEKLQKMSEDDKIVVAKILTVHAVKMEIEGFSRVATHIVNDDIADDGQRILTLSEGEIMRYFEKFDPNHIDIGKSILHLEKREYGMTEALASAGHREVHRNLF